MIRLKVKEVAEAKGFSMGRLHRDAGVDRKTVQRIYREPLSEISTITLDRLATALGVHVYDLFEYTPNPPRTPLTE
ncbi:MAG: helix-turn-helix domain-containing protein [Ktedonobacteraceae bacterium]|jgi:DNA-binding Xre family transcriptional regulator